MKFSSFGVVEMVLEDANKKFAPLFQPVQERVDFLKQYCDAFDVIIDEQEADQFNVEVDEKDMTVHISLVMMTVECSRTQPQLGQLIQRAMSFSVQAEDKENIRLSFVYPSLWEKAV